jgi:hypothetical protein
MERLTFDGRFCDIAQCTETPGGSFCEDGYCSQRKVWERLKQYEDTGYTPEEIAKLQGDLIQRNAELLKAREDLQSAKNTADQHAAINDTLYDSNAKLAADRKDLINELCQYCGKYKQAHEGACDGCKWREK